MTKRRVSYLYDPDVGAFSYGLGHCMKPFRMRLAHSLITAYDMLPRMDVLRPHRATPEQMTRFHTDEYISFLQRVTPETARAMTGDFERFLILDDNPAFDGLFEFCSISVGGSLVAAERLNAGLTDIAINWSGGLHHAKKAEASGFCYTNDIVLCILELLRYHTRVLYIDIDVHHGDGVEEAFYTTDRVLTLSFHKQRNFFPGSGTINDQGAGKGKGYAVNVPFLNGVTDEDYMSVFEPVVQRILDWYRPEAVVLQCGADSLSGDKLGTFNLSLQGHAACVQFLRRSGVPLVLLGGGGYTTRNVASAWCYETACAIGMEGEIDENMPWSQHFEWYGPRYRLEVLPSNMENDNHKKGYLNILRETVMEQLRDLPFAPSVQSQATPQKSVAQEIGLEQDDDDEEEDLDTQIRRHVRRSIFPENYRHEDEDDEDVDADIERTDEDDRTLYSGRGVGLPVGLRSARQRINLYINPKYNLGHDSSEEEPDDNDEEGEERLRGTPKRGIDAVDDEGDVESGDMTHRQTRSRRYAVRSPIPSRFASDPISIGPGVYSPGRVDWSTPRSFFRR